MTNYTKYTHPLLKWRRNADLVRDREINHLSFPQLAKRYHISITRAQQIYKRERSDDEKNSTTRVVGEVFKPYV